MNSLKAYHQLPGLDIFVFIYVVPQLAVTTDHGSILECGMGCNGYTCYYKIQIRKCQAKVFKTCGHKRQMFTTYNLYKAYSCDLGVQNKNRTFINQFR